jgi:4-amino-4-deoxy-L-arabinose transferase-like glycosyltransferase
MKHLTNMLSDFLINLDKLKLGKPMNFLKKHFNPIIFLILLMIIVSVITYWRVMIQIDIGPLSDSVDFFTNALFFAGQGIGYSDLIRPPFFSFIISLFVRMGYTSLNTLFAVDGGFFVFGVIGFYLLLKTRFNEIESFLGSLFYATFPIILVVLGVGFSDLSSVSLTIWAFYFTILAVRKDSRFFYLAFPFVMFAFLARYNSAIIIFPIFLYISIRWDEIRGNNIQNIKNMLIGILASFLVFVPVLIFFYQKFGNLFYPFITFASSTSNLLSPQNASYNPNLLFFLEKSPYYIGSQGALDVLIIAAGIFAYAIIKTRRNSRVKVDCNSQSKNLFQELKLVDTITKIKLTVFIFLLFIFIGTFGQIFYMISEFIFFISIYLFYDTVKSLEITYLDIDILFLAWFMGFFIFHSIFVIKDSRYFVTMAPAVAYFLVFGLSEISKRIQLKIKNRNLTFPIIAVILTVIILLSTVSYLPIIQEVNKETKVTNEEIKIVSEWLVIYDSDYKNKNIYSDIWPDFSLYMKTNVKKVPIFKDNNTYVSGVKNETFSPDDSITFNNYLVKNDAYYYLSIRQGLNLTSYVPIKQFGKLTIYKKKT